MVRICLCVHVCVAHPMIVGAWSMAVVLWQYMQQVDLFCQRVYVIDRRWEVKEKETPWKSTITQYSSTVYIGIAMVYPH